MTGPHPETLPTDDALEATVPAGGPLMASREFAKASDARGGWQLVSTVGCLVGIVLAMRALDASPWRFLLILPIVGIFMRIFVLQHDCGHLSLLSSRKLNDAAGSALSWLTGIAYHAWRSEHNWHHGNQGRLSRRGVDRMNSPMTVEEAQVDPAGATLREKKISWLNVFFLGTLSLVVERKRHHAFFMFRPKFQGPVPDRDALVRSVWTTNLGHVGYHAVMIAALGWSNWLFVMVPGMLAGAGVGALLFWVQHNFEHTYHAPDGAWNYVEVAIKGSSYLNWPWPLSWFSGEIGLHHVHHLNPLIPNYRLNEARKAIPELAAVTPLGWADLGRCFTHIFWDGAQGRMVAPTGDATG